MGTEPPGPAEQAAPARLEDADASGPTEEADASERISRHEKIQIAIAGLAAVATFLAAYAAWKALSVSDRAADASEQAAHASEQAARLAASVDSREQKTNLEVTALGESFFPSDQMAIIEATITVRNLGGIAAVIDRFHPYPPKYLGCIARAQRDGDRQTAFEPLVIEAKDALTFEVREVVPLDTLPTRARCSKQEVRHSLVAPRRLYAIGVNRSLLKAVIEGRRGKTVLSGL